MDIVRSDDEDSRGGALSRGEIGWLLRNVTTATDVYALGSKPRLPIKEGADPSKH